jgi:hypothetical protein
VVSFPDLQEKPMVVNLWGLTGVGKTSLINRLVTLLSIGDNYHYFDLGEYWTYGHTLKDQLAEIYEFMNGAPMVLALDEFQHACTLNENGFETDKSTSRIIWQLLDSGRFQMARDKFHIDGLHDLILKLKHMILHGVTVSNGIVVSKVQYFLKNLGVRQNQDEGRKTIIKGRGDQPMFVHESFHDLIYGISRELFGSIYHMVEKFKHLDGPKTISLLEKILAHANSPKVVDCSKSFIFVLGNLDEAFRMSKDFNPDMDADEFHEQSLKINIPMIKHALQKRFRSEQISRLGNMHIIYPAFSKESFDRIISMELDKIRKKISDKHKIDVFFDQSMQELIYREGVYPTQGARPVISTIDQVVRSKLAWVMSQVLLCGQHVTGLLFLTKDGAINVDFIRGNSKVKSMTLPLDLHLEPLRATQKDDSQAITAVHESGHAVISCILLSTAPEIVYSTTATNDQAGFMFAKFNWKYVSRKEIGKRLALYFGGYAAEKLVFGEENLTAGAEEDIMLATQFITEMLKHCGMGPLPAAYHSEGENTRNFLHDTGHLLNQEVEAAIRDGLALAERTLKTQEALLLHMADHLSDNRQLSKQQIIDLVQAHARDFDADCLNAPSDVQPYRQALKNKVASLGDMQQSASYGNKHEFILNWKNLKDNYH